jgi:Fe2+ or Zn2+ uptake regulation protein
LTDTVRKRYGFKATKIELYLEGYCQKCEDKLGKSVTLVVAGGG